MIAIEWIRRHAHWFYGLAAVVLTVLWIRYRNRVKAEAQDASALDSAMPDASNAYQPDLSSFFANLYAGGSSGLSQGSGGAISPATTLTTPPIDTSSTIGTLPYLGANQGTNIISLTPIPGGATVSSETPAFLQTSLPAFNGVPQAGAGSRKLFGLG